MVDLALFSGAATTPRNERSRLLLVGARHGINSALLVESTLGLKPLSGLQKTDLPLDTPSVSWVDAAYKDEQGRVWLHIALADLLQDPVFLDIGL